MTGPSSPDALRVRLAGQGVHVSARAARRLWKDWQVLLDFQRALPALPGDEVREPR
jgi:hypothetical protein